MAPASSSPAASGRSLLWLVAIGFFMQMLDATIVNTALPMATYFGGSDTSAKGWQMTMIIYASAATLLYVLTFWMTKERVKPDASQKTSLKDDVADLFRNRPWMVLCAVGIAALTYANIRGTVAIYYFENVVPGGKGWFGAVMTTGAVAFIVGVMATSPLAKRFGKLLGIDPWLINPIFAKAEGVDFAEGVGMDQVAAQVDAVLTKTRRKYKEYGINEKPFAVVKADNGTYGMGIMTVRDAKELEEVSRRTRNKMAVSKDGQRVRDVIIQEGVLTNERINDAVAEPVVYMMDRYVVGGFYRVHADRSVDENLNAPGAKFVPLAFEQSNYLPQPGVKPGASAPNRFYMYGVVARLAMAAASYELEATDPDREIYD